MSLTDDEARRLRDALSLIATSVEPPRTDVEPPRTDSVINPGEPPRAKAPQSRRARLAAGVLVAAGVAAAAAFAWSVTGGGQTGGEAPDGSDMAAESAQSPGEYWACAETIVEGTVTDVQPAGRDRLRVVVDTSSWIKPASGPATIRLDLPDPETQGLAGIRPDTAYLLSVPTNDHLPADVFRGEDIADGLRVIAEGRDQARAQGITECPRYWQELRPY
jgi:hypothetical protein